MYNASEIYCDKYGGFRSASPCHMAQIEVTHRRLRRLRFLRILQISLDLGSHIAARRIRSHQVPVVSAGIQCRQHRENRLAAIQGNRCRPVLPHAVASQHPKNHRNNGNS